MKQFIAVLYILGIVLLPLYTGESGGIQPAHFFWVVASCLTMLVYGMHLGVAEKLLGVLAIYVLCRELYYSAYHDESGLIHAAYIVYGFVTASAISVFYAEAGKRYHSTLVFALLLAGVFAVGGLIVTGYSLTLADEGKLARGVGTFTNPNQLGYFGLCLIAASIVLRYLNVKSELFSLTILAIAVFCVLASASRAAFVALAFPIIVISLRSASGGRRSLWVTTTLAALLLAGAYYLLGNVNLEDFSLYERFVNRGGGSLEERGYGVLWNVGATELFFGYGYWGTVEINGLELHSTIFSMFANYGVIGGGLFLLFTAYWIYILFRAGGLFAVLGIAAPLLVYGLTHNGSRFAAYWMVVGLSLLLQRYEVSRHRRKRRRHRHRHRAAPNSYRNIPV